MITIYAILLAVSMEEISNLNARLSCMEIEKKGLSRKFGKVKETSKQKDYRIRSLQESKSNHDGNVQTVSDGGSAFSALIKHLVDSKVTGPSIVSNVMDSLVAQKKLHSHIKNYLTSNDFLQQLPSAHQFCQKTIYSSLREKFKPWVCL
jgi:hypothetical protein